MLREKLLNYLKWAHRIFFIFFLFCTFLFILFGYKNPLFFKVINFMNNSKFFRFFDWWRGRRSR